ncbi:hypothetical protein BGZ65_003477, partial [Modicella reniformis]
MPLGFWGECVSNRPKGRKWNVGKEASNKSNFSETQTVLMKQQFNSLDTDSDGFITEQEFIKCIENSGRNPQEYDHKKFFLETDENKDGKITFAEFLKVCGDMGLDKAFTATGGAADEGSKNADETFRRFDRDHD